MSLPDKLYPNYNDGYSPSGSSFKFETRDPAKEMAYTAQIMAELFKAGGDWESAELTAGNILTNRFINSEGSIYTSANQKLGYVKDAVSAYVQPSGTNDTAYAQYLLGMSASFGNGHTSIGGLLNVTSQDKRLQILEMAIKQYQGLAAITHQATSAMPLLVPVESQLVADACASAVESYALGEIRNQQVRQSKAAGTIMAGVNPSMGTNPTPSDEVVMFASIHAAGAAANTD